MLYEEFTKAYTISPLHDRKDFIKAWLNDNENIPAKLKTGINIIPLKYGEIFIVYANKKRKAIGILSLYKNRVGHIVVSDEYSHKGIATTLLKEARKLGVTDVRLQFHHNLHLWHISL